MNLHTIQQYEHTPGVIYLGKKNSAKAEQISAWLDPKYFPKLTNKIAKVVKVQNSHHM